MIRDVIQAKLEEVKELDEVTPELPNDVIEEEKTYMSFSVYQNYQDGDFDKNYTYKVQIIGYIKRKDLPTENTLEIIDIAGDKTLQKLKDLNIKATIQDVSMMDGIRKKKIIGDCSFNEINKGLY